MIFPDSNFPILMVLKSGALIPIRLIRQMDSKIYSDVVFDRDWVLIPPVGQRIAVRWADDDALYQQEGTLSEILARASIFVIVLKDTPVSVEKRSHLRIRVAVPIEYRMLRSDSPTFNATTIDLSSVGLRFPSSIPLWKGLHLKMTLRIPDKRIALLGEVVRAASVPTEIHRVSAWETAIAYKEITAIDKRWVEQYILAQINRNNTPPQEGP